MREYITKEEKVMIAGMTAIAKYHFDKVVESEKAINALLELEEENGMVSDMIFGGDFDYNYLLKTLKVKIHPLAPIIKT